VSICFEKGIDGLEQRLAVDCYEMESSTPSFQHCLQNPLVVAGAKLGRKKRKGIFVNRWVKKHLGFIRSKLDRILGGLALKPKGKCIRVELFRLEHPVPMVDLGLGSGLDTGLDTGLGSGLIPGLDTGLVFAPFIGSNVDLEPVSESRSVLGTVHIFGQVLDPNLSLASGASEY
jgi:hypothetical protein